MSTHSPKAEDILQCARSLILAGGYDGFSYADISKVVGIRNASIHHHFPAKADLVRALVAAHRENAEAGIAQLDRNIADPVDRLRAYVGYWETCIGDTSVPFCVCALLAGQLPSLPGPVADEVRGYFRSLAAWLASVLERGAAQRRIRLIGTAQSEAEVFMATIHGAMLSARAYGDPAMFGVITRQLLDRLVVRK
ncbi:MAG TPA: TetR/AcrR family transcriptional regulator [Tahibacter sp.]|nr:TetR/AcrR family transcriptional regulator [Tahibacter sp.]